jgi:hypothetical protein
MEEKFLKLEQIMQEDGKIEEIFSGSKEEILNKLAGYDIVLTVEELDDLKKGFNEVMSASADDMDELSDELLDDVAGGCKACSNHGYSTGVKVAKTIRKIKNFVCFWDW